MIAVSGALLISGTSAAAPTTIWEAPYVHAADPTVSGSGPGWERVARPLRRAPESTREAVGELRRISGLTWEQLAQLFEVSRRSVHFWASGKPLNAANEARLLRVLDVVRHADRGDARSTRAALLDATAGMTPLELLAAQRFDDARAALGSGVMRRERVLTPLSAAAQAAREPLPVEALLEAKSERVHRDPGHARAARTVRNKRRGSS